MSYFEDYIEPGILCEGCGVFMGDECGYIRRCSACERDAHHDVVEQGIIKSMKEHGHQYHDDLTVIRNISNAAKRMRCNNITYYQAIEKISHQCGFHTYASLRAALGED